MIYCRWGEPIKIVSYNEETEWVEYKYIDQSEHIVKNHKDTLRADNGWKEIEEALRRIK